MKITLTLMGATLTAIAGFAAGLFSADDPWLQANGVAVRTFSEELVPVAFEETDPGAKLLDVGRWQDKVDLLLYSIAGEPLELGIEVGMIYPDRGPLVCHLTRPDGTEVTDPPTLVELKLRVDPHQLRLEVPEPGLYRLRSGNGDAGWRLADTARDCPLVVSVRERAFHHHGYTSLEYFYVPKGTRDIAYFWKGGPHFIEAPDGNQTALADIPPDGKLIKVPVPAGMDGKPWKFHYMNLNQLQFINCPNYLAFSRTGLMVPEDLVEKDELFVRIPGRKRTASVAGADHSPVSFDNVTAAVMPGVSNSRAAWADFDNDGLVDVIAGSLWLNRGGEGFEKAGGGPSIPNYADFNNDGFIDWFDGANGRFNLGASGGGSIEGRPHTVSDGSTLLDIDGDGLIDVYWAGYENEGYLPDGLFRNIDGKSFKLLWQTPGRAQPARGITACDFDNDGDTDIYVTHYRLEANVLLINDGKGLFTDQAAAYGAQGGNGHGIGSAWGDIDNDGNIDLFAGNFSHPGQPQSRFLRNHPDTHHFEDKGTCGVHWQESYASPTLGDYDNDGDLDLFFTVAYGGDVPVLYRNDSKRFQGKRARVASTSAADVRETSTRWLFTNVTAAAGLDGLGTTTQAAWADYDNDGDLDLLAGGNLFRNRGTKNNWLKVKLVGNARASSPQAGAVNRAAIGAQVRVLLGTRTLTRQVESGTGANNQNDLTLHFGLGLHSQDVRLEISWPYAGKQIVTTPVNRLVTITMAADDRL